MRRLFLLPLLILAACSSAEKYPSPPQFVAADAVPARVLGAPPAAHSATYDKEIRCILARQATLDAPERTTIAAEDHITPEMLITPTLGKRITPEAYPALYTLLRHAASDAWRIGDTQQDYWGRTRPWLSDARVDILVSTIHRPSYPSGHSTTNHVWAYILSDLVPAQHDAFFDRAYAIGQHRVEAGVHYPSDVEAGKRLAGIVYAQMKQTPSFRHEFEAAKRELQRKPLARKA